jgi:YidC/Oxa1 family membrane protein insertase
VSPLSLLDPLVHVAYLGLTALASALPGVSGGPALAVSILLVTVLVRLLLLPLAVLGVRAQRSRSALAPEILRLRRRYRHDRARMAEEIAAAHRRAGIRPLAGVGPAVLQLPLASTLYRVVVVPTIAGQPNTIVTATLFGSTMSAHWPEVLAASGLVSAGGALLMALVALVTTLAWVSSRQAAAATVAAAEASGPAAWLPRVLPFASVVFLVASPVAVGLYLATTTAWTVAERAVLPRLV